MSITCVPLTISYFQEALKLYVLLADDWKLASVFKKENIETLEIIIQ